MRLIFCLFFLGAWIRAASAPPPDQGKQVVDQAVAALGGDKFLNFHSRSAGGRMYSFFRNQISGFERVRLYTEYLSTPPKDGLAIRERQLLGKKQDYSYLYLPDGAWELTFRGARPVDPEAWDRYRRTTRNDILYILKMRHDEPGMTFDYVGSQVQITRHVEIVDITDSTGQTVRVYFDHNSHFPVRQSFEWVDQATHQRNDEVTDYDKYRDIGGGIYWPWTVERARNGYKAFQIFAESMDVNEEAPPHTFELPAGAPILRK